MILSRFPLPFTKLTINFFAFLVLWPKMIAKLNRTYSGFPQELYWHFSQFQCDRNDNWFPQRRIDEYIGYKLENGEDVSMVLYNIESLKNTFSWVLQRLLTIEKIFTCFAKGSENLDMLSGQIQKNIRKFTWRSEKSETKVLIDLFMILVV